MYILRHRLPNFIHVHYLMFLFTLQDGTTPLSIASRNDHERVVKLLLGAKSDVNKATDVS